MALWIVAVVAVVIALAAMMSARRLARRLDQMTQAYWELRYDYTRLRSQVERLDPEHADASSEPGAGDSAGAPAAPTVSFVPLSSMKKKSSSN